MYIYLSRENNRSIPGSRPELRKMISHLRDEDVVMIWKLDRLARYLQDLISLVNQIQQKGPGLHSLNHIDTGTLQEKFTFHIFAALSEFELDIIRERTLTGLPAARAPGRNGTT